MIYSGLVSATLKEKDIYEVVKICKEFQLKGIEWSSNCHLPQGNLAKAEEIKKLCASNEIGIAGYASYYFLGRYEDYTAEFAPYLACAITLDAPSIRIWGGDQGSLELTKERRDALLNEALVISEMASRAGIVLSYEYHQHSLMDEIESVLDLLEKVPLSNTHWQIPENLTVMKNIIEITVLKDKISNIHVQNRKKMIYYPLNEAKSEWEQYFAILPKNQKKHYACIEIIKDISMKQLQEDSYTLNKILENFA